MELLIKRAFLALQGDKRYMRKINVDVNKPVENKRFVGMLEERAQISPDDPRWNQLMDDICRYVAQEGVFLSIVHLSEGAGEPNGDGTATFRKGDKLAFESLAASDDSTFFPVYTDWENLRKNPSHKDDYVKTCIFRFEDLCAMAKNDTGVVINPFSHNLILVNELLNHMFQKKNQSDVQVKRMCVEHDTQVQLGEPRDYPTQMVEAIKKYAKSNKSINAIYLKLMIKEGEKSFLLIVDGYGDVRSNAFGGIAKAGQPYIPSGMYIDMIPYNDDFGRSAADNEPFYKKKKFLIF